MCPSGTFLGKELAPQFEGEIGNRFNTRIEGTRIKHTMGPASLKLYDKFGLILRIETTVNNLAFFKHYREVEHRNGGRETKWAAMQKTIYSSPTLRELLDEDDDQLLRVIARGEFNVSGMQNKTVRRPLAGKTSTQVSRMLRRLLLHRLIRKIGRTYKYYLTPFGKQVITTGLKLRELVVIPQPACGQIA